MKIAILMLIHEYKEQQKILIKNLSKDFDVFVHIDRSSNIKEAEVSAARVFAFKKYNVFWGSFNQILATLFLFKTANSFFYERYIFISGSDIPLKTNSQIIYFFENTNKEYFDYSLLPKNEWKNENYGFDRLDYFYSNNWSRKKRWTFRWIIGKCLTKFNDNLIIPLCKRFNLRRKRLRLNYYGGANWMDLTGNCVSQIVNFVNSNTKFVKKFKYTLCADEIFFQTVILNFVKDVVIENKCLRFVDWQHGPEWPRILRNEDFNYLCNSIAEGEELFARKFNPNVDSVIMEKIYEKIGFDYSKDWLK